MTWICVKEAAAMVGISVQTFRAEWVPEVGVPQVTFRNANGRRGMGRRVEVNLEDLEVVLATRTTVRTG